MGAPKPNADAGGIVGIGWIEPASRVVAVTGPADGGTVKELFVDQGSVIKAGDVLADLDGYDVHHADLAAAESAVHLAELQRQQVKSGAKDADIAAQRNAVAASEARVRRLRQQWERRSQVPIDTVVSREVLDASKADLEQAEHSLDQARNTLKSLSETRGIDEKVAEAQIAVAHAAMKRARAAADRLQIRAPTSGTVLSLQARKGEAIGVDGLLRMGDLSKLIVVAEIDGDLIGGISIGMPATLSGSVLKEEMQARVSRIANEIYRRKRPNSDILIGRDAKVLEVELETAAPLPPILGSEITVRFGAKPRPQ